MIFIYDFYSPAYKAGGPIQSLKNLIDQLDTSFDTHFICSNRDVDGTVLPVSANKWLKCGNADVYYSTGDIWTALKLLNPDSRRVFFINGIFSYKFNFQPAVFCRGRKIVSVRGMLHPQGLMQKKIKKHLYLSVWKLLGLHRTCEYHATSLQEASYIRNVFGSKTKIWVLPNFPNKKHFVALPEKVKGSLRLCTVALISRMKNILLVLQALQDSPYQIEYDIYGAVIDDKYWAICESAIKLLPSNVVVHYHGSIPPQLVSSALANCHVFVQPSESENFGHSLLEALSTGRPVITSRNTPWNMLEEADAGFNVTTDNLSELKSAICRFAEMENDTLKNYSISARIYAETAIDTGNLRDKYLRMFKGII